MAFTALERVELRRFAGFPALGSAGTPATAEALAFENALTGASAEEEGFIRDTLLPRFRAADAALAKAMATVHTAKAAVWTRNENAQAEAEAYLATIRRDLLGLLVLPDTLIPAGAEPIPAIFVV